MSSTESHGPTIRQTFKTRDEQPLLTIATHVCIETGKRYVLWSDIQKNFIDINYLQNWSDERVLFMINNYGRLYDSLRIEYNPDDSYTVVSLGLQSLPALERMLEMCTHLYNRLKFEFETDRTTFQQIAANTRYHHDLLLEEVEKLGNANAAAQEDRMGREKIQKLDILEQKVLDWTHRNICYNMLYEVPIRWEYATSKLFIVLPSGADIWDDQDSSVHHFRLYFLCDNHKKEVSLKNMPQHVHIANHPGYNLLNPQDFFKKYGDYVLRVLRMVKQGCKISCYDIPPIDPSKILWKCDPVVIGSHLTKDTITDLVDQAIRYIQKLSPPDSSMEPGLTRNHCAAVKDFLDVQDGENTEGNLHRYIDPEQKVTWRCQLHKHQYFQTKPLEDLEAFIGDNGGHVDMQQTKLKAVLQSHTKADQFQNLVRGTPHIFHLTLKLHWKTQRTELHRLCVDVARTKAAVLNVDGVTLESHPQGYIDYTLNLFADKVVPESELQLITLVNYPRSEEQCLHLGKFSLQTTVSSTRPAHDWVELKADLDKFGKMFSLAADASDCQQAVEALQSTLEKHRYPENTLVTIHESGWSVVCTPEKGGVVEVYSHGADCPRGVYFCESLRKLTVHMNNLELDHDFFRLVQTVASLQELNVSYHGSDVLYYIDSIVKMWHDASSPFRLTLIDRMEDTQGRVVAQMNIRPSDSDRYRSEGSTREDDCSDNVSTSNQSNKSDATRIVDIPIWDSDQLTIKPSDFAASIINKGTEQHPSVLNSLTLDTSKLSRDGLASISKVLGRSDLDHLNMVCNPFDPKLSSPVAEVLDSIRLNALKSLVLSGSNIDGWIKLWPPPGTGTPQLIHLGIRGPVSKKQNLSHASVLAIHDMIYPSPLIDLKFEHVGLQEPRDWALIAGALDPKSLKTLGLCERSKAQFELCPEAMDIIKGKFAAKKCPMAPNSKGPVLASGVTGKPGYELPPVKDALLGKPGYELPPVKDALQGKPGYELHAVKDPMLKDPGYELPPVKDALQGKPGYELHAVKDPMLEEPGYELHAVKDPMLKKPGDELHAVKDPMLEEPGYELHAVKDPMLEKPKPSFWRRMCCCCCGKREK
ncbi:hypothetical protein BGZ92_008658 [Podila epicladia]|nr:hypothetical protein BGZ92_008658 [Podila epicladia]